MKQNKTLHQIAQRLKRKELIKYASNLHIEFDEKWDTSKLCEVYTQYILSHPKELLLMLPKTDLDIIKKAKNVKAGEGVERVDDHLKPIMVMYGLADIDTPEEGYIIITIAKDLLPLLTKHIDWALEYEHNQQRMSVEIIVEGLANIFGIVTQDEIKQNLRQLIQTDDVAVMTKALDVTRQFSLLLDSMEYAEDLENAKDEDIRFVSRYAWEDKQKMEQFIALHSKDITSVPEFSFEELIKSSGTVVPLIPNAKRDEFIHFLTHQIGLDLGSAYTVCFNLWYYKIHYGEYTLDDMPMEVYFLSHTLIEVKKELTDKEANEWMLHLTDFVNNMPLWHLRGFTAADYPTEAFVSKITTKGSLGSVFRKIKKEANLITDLLNEKKPLPNKIDPSKEDNPWAKQNIGRNEPCPCGSGLKYKKCHGKNL